MIETPTSEVRSQTSSATAAAPRPKAQPAAKPARRGRLVLGLVVAAILCGGIWFVTHTEGKAHAPASASARRPVVAVATVDREDLVQSLTLSAEFHPYQQVALHAKIAGYLQGIWVDVGDEVKEG